MDKLGIYQANKTYICPNQHVALGLFVIPAK